MLLAQFSETDRQYAFIIVICRPFQRLHWAHNFLWGAAIADLGWLNIRQLRVPAGIPQAKHKCLYSLQTLRQLDIVEDT